MWKDARGRSVVAVIAIPREPVGIPKRFVGNYSIRTHCPCANLIPLISTGTVGTGRTESRTVVEWSNSVHCRCVDISRHYRSSIVRYPIVPAEGDTKVSRIPYCLSVSRGATSRRSCTQFSWLPQSVEGSGGILLVPPERYFQISRNFHNSNSSTLIPPRFPHSIRDTETVGMNVDTPPPLRFRWRVTRYAAGITKSTFPSRTRTINP